MIEIVEVGPRDGLQNESATLTTKEKIDFIERAVAAGVGRVEVASFVNPKRVPQMADAEAVIAGLSPRAKEKAIGLVLNERGLERALAAGIGEINYVVAVTDGFAYANQNTTTEGLLAEWERVAPQVRGANLRSSVTFSVALGCPFEGEVRPERVRECVRRVMENPPDEIAFGDTIGAGDPGSVRTLLDEIGNEVNSAVGVRCHFHNTRNVGLANAWVAAEWGATALDASIGGVGGCPFAPRATGNIATEDLVWMLERAGYETRTDLARLLDAASFVEKALGHPIPSMLSKAGPFPAA